jgi:hypothetical protein
MATTKTRKKVVRSKQPSRAQEAVFADARNVLRATRAKFAGFQKYDAKRTEKLLPKSRVDAFSTLIQTTTTQVGGSRTRSTLTKRATATEARARAAAFALVQEIRGVVNVAVTDDAAMRKAFLIGVKVEPKTTSAVIKAAADVQQAWEDSAYKARASKLGINQAMITSLVAKRRALTTADTTGQGEQATKVGATMAAAAGLRSIEKETAYVRKVAKLAFKGDAKTLAQFAKKVPRAVARPKKTPTTPGGSGGAT